MNRILALAAAGLGFLSTGCIFIVEDNDPPAYYAPSKPTGLTSVTGDQLVTLYWAANPEPDISYYEVYRSYSASGPWSYLASTSATFYVDAGLTNGVTYYWRVAAVNVDYISSGLSSEVIYDTPRPEGSNLMLFDAYVQPGLSGFDFSLTLISAWNDPLVDIYYEQDPITFEPRLVCADAFTDIQDMGPVNSLDDVTWAPSSGWSPTGMVTAVPGNAYVVWTRTNNYAKVLITTMGPTWVMMDWAYQTDIGNPELFTVDQGGAGGAK